MFSFPGKQPLRQWLADRIAPNASVLFVLSTGRCGTTSLASVLELSDRIHATHEPKPWYLEETRNAYLQSPVPPETARANMEAFTSTRLKPLLRAATIGPIYAECSNRLTYYAPELLNWFPNSKYVHLYRHPGDVVRSGIRRGYYTGNSNWDLARITPREDDPAFEMWENWPQFERCCWYWHAVNAYCADFMRTLPEGRGLSIAAEDLFVNRDDIGTRVFEWLGAPPPPRGRIESVLSTPENVQQSGDFPKYRDWTPAQRATLNEIAGATAARLGYEIRADEPSIA
ncbi:MAG: sulfotransferase [Planctomyces sp.]|nr:sulfotransferase [Planctomyces sp.]